MEWTSLVLLDNLYLYHITTLIASLSLQTSWGRRLIYSNLLLNSCQWLMRHLTISSSVQKTLKEQKLRTINCVSIHYRNVDEKSWDLAGRRVNDVLNGFSCLRLTHGCKVLEVRPVINWDKGKAGTFLLESLGFNNCNNVLPIYIDDDRTDEDAFKVLRDGNKGYGILVSSEPKESNTICSRRDP